MTASSLSVATHEPATPPAAIPPPSIPSWLILLLATSCGLIVADLYYAQPLVGPIGASLGLPPSAAGLIVTVTQIGYCAGLIFIVPLSDIVENRRLVLTILTLAAVALAGAAIFVHPATFLLSMLCIGLGSVAAQVLIPYASHLAPEAIRGRVVGNVMSGLMLGIMLARPASSFIAELLSWNAVFAIAAVVMACLIGLLALVLPKRHPQAKLRYGALLLSLFAVLQDTKVLRRRAFYQAFLFGAFSLFWTTVPILLAQTYHLSQNGIALFALAGVAGAIAAPIAGRVADRGWTRIGTGLAMAAVAAAFLISRLAVGGTDVGLALLVISAIVLDFGATANLVLGQRMIYALGAEFRSRMNAIFMATSFAGGAIGSALGGWSYAQDGWSLAAWIGLALPVLALAAFATERTTAHAR